MRLYLMHREAYLNYLKAQSRVEEILDEREQLIQSVMPKSSLAEHEREFLPTSVPVKGRSVNKAERYAIEMEERLLKTRLEEATDALEHRKLILSERESELRKSHDIYNLVYTAKWIDGKKVEAIVKDTGYSRSQIYHIIGYLTGKVGRY